MPERKRYVSFNFKGLSQQIPNKGKWLYSCYFVWCCFQGLKQHTTSLCSYDLVLSNRFVRVQVVQPYISINLTIAWKNSHSILSGRSDFHMVNNMSIPVRTLPIGMLTSLSVDEILLLRYMCERVLPWWRRRVAACQYTSGVWSIRIKLWFKKFESQEVG